jgi:hypothetical protein
MAGEKHTLTPGTASFSTPLSRAIDVTTTDNVIIETSATVQPPLVTPEAVRSNFLALRQLMNDYVEEERTKSIHVQLSFDEPDVIGTTTPLPANPFSVTPVSATHQATKNFVSHTIPTQPSQLTGSGVASRITSSTAHAATTGLNGQSTSTSTASPNKIPMPCYAQNGPSGPYPMPGAPGTIPSWPLYPWGSEMSPAFPYGIPQ